MTSPLPTEALEAIIAGCDRATQGMWLADPDDREGMEWNIHIISADNPDLRICFMANGPKTEDDAAHIARLSPEVVRAMATELLRLRVALEQITDGPFPILAGDWRGQAAHMQRVAQQALTEGATHGR